MALHKVLNTIKLGGKDVDHRTHAKGEVIDVDPKVAAAAPWALQAMTPEEIEAHKAAEAKKAAKKEIAK